MDYHSKNVCLIGVLHFLYNLICSIEPLTETYNGAHYDGFNHYQALGGYFVFMAASAALMIRGVIKKNHKLVGPFFIALNMLLIHEVLLVLEEFIFDYGILLFFLEKRCYRIGIIILSIYPICTLYAKLRIQWLKENPSNDSSEEEKKKASNALNQKLVV